MKTIKGFALLVLFSVCLLLPFTGCNSGAEGPTLIIENGKIELGFDKQDGTISYFREVEGSRELIDTSIIHGSLWEMDIIKSSGIEKVDMYAAANFSYSIPDPSTLLLEWSDFQSLENKDLKIVAKVSLEKDKAMSNWSISLEGTKGLEISRVVFPRVNGLLDMGNEHLAVPTWLGYLYNNPRESLVEMAGRSIHKRMGKQASYTFSYPGISLQMLAWYDPDTYGLYLACNDSAAYSKNFSFSLDTDENLMYEVINFPSVDANSDEYSPSVNP